MCTYRVYSGAWGELWISQQRISAAAHLDRMLMNSHVEVVCILNVYQFILHPFCTVRMCFYGVSYFLFNTHAVHTITY